VSKKPYRGVNIFLLSASKYISPSWLTLRQANQLGGRVRKGEESSIVTFWKVEDMKPTEDVDNDDSEEKTRRRFLLRLYRVFNLEQCELPEAALNKLPKIETHQCDPIDSAERIITGMPNAPEIEYAGSKAFYRVSTDRITIPPRSLFESVEEFYSTLDHEMIHACGSPKQLNRESIAEAAPFGSPTYSREEMVAELGAAYLCAEAGISNVTIANQASYIAVAQEISRGSQASDSRRRPGAESGRLHSRAIRRTPLIFRHRSATAERCPSAGGTAGTIVVAWNCSDFCFEIPYNAASCRHKNGLLVVVSGA